MIRTSALALALLLPLARSRPQEPAPAFVCPPCGGECHFTTYPREGSCGGCGMGLVPLASVAQIGVLLHPEADLSAAMLTLAVFVGSNAGRTFTVADTVEPLRLSDALEVRPQFAFADAPALDVLVVPGGYGAWEDPLLVEWVKAAAARARCVLAVDTGSVVLAQAGFLAGERVPARGGLAQRGKDLAPELVFDATLPWRRAGKLFLARDTEGALDAALAVVQELAGEERARRTAEALGRPWKPAAK